MLYINIQIITLENVKNDVKIVECIVMLTSHSPVTYSMVTDQLVTLAMNTLQLTAQYILDIHTIQEDIVVRYKYL